MTPGQLPHPDGAFDAVVRECALCAFPARIRAAAGFARVLKPGGRLGITDVMVTPSGCRASSPASAPGSPASGHSRNSSRDRLVDTVRGCRRAVVPDEVPYDSGHLTKPRTAVVT
ncbi:methyltransferase domain-containing protein [Streptomyces sp. DG2A-72]|uniref:class I SAM-dependent methyltransferase n=1 Tax=Streptomyces sp. DG2A-72 TaxID=3051386 RepID=UPI00265BCCDA|nr:methyltransferase domain-containing protein [Streptomyces sp. DG2A-72]MDO0933472.1 methyltransferase domain-containing protein [Streptomyces sp. DG2A-72]